MASCNNICAAHLSGFSSPRSASKLQNINHYKVSPPFFDKPQEKKLQCNIPLLQINPTKTIKEASIRLLDAFVDLVFHFVDEPLLPSQSNFAPVEEIGGRVHASINEGSIPDDFPEGVYIRNGSNPIFGGLKSAVSIFGKTSLLWVEGEGMLHALYFSRKNKIGNWEITYNNKHVETETFKLEKKRNKPCLLPAIEGDPPAVISSFLLNVLRFGTPDKHFSNTNIIEHSGKFYSISENYLPQEIDIHTLETFGDWNVNGLWTRPFTSHPKKAPGSNELVMMGVDAQKPYFEVGVISADGTKMIHKMDLEFDRCTFSHEMGVTKRFNVILDFPVIIDLNRVINGGAIIKYEKERYSRIGVMPRYGDASSVQWFQLDATSAFHIINCFEDGDEVVVIACRARGSIIPGPDFGRNKFEWFSRGFKRVKDMEIIESEQDGSLFYRAHEWRLNLKTGDVKQGYITGTEYSMDFPMINPNMTGVRNKFGYTQVIDSCASAIAGLPKYGGLAKLYLEERHKLNDDEEKLVKVEYHMLPRNTYCSGAAFVAKPDAVEEDDGWIISFVHDEDTETSLVYILDAKHLSREPVAKIAMPSRVPYGFHGIFTSRVSK